MFIVLLDGPELLVFQSPADAVREVEPIDAESEIPGRGCHPFVEVRLSRGPQPAERSGAVW
jgi:hypothetical protein